MDEVEVEERSIRTSTWGTNKYHPRSSSYSTSSSNSRLGRINSIGNSITSLVLELNNLVL